MRNIQKDCMFDYFIQGMDAGLPDSATGMQLW